MSKMNVFITGADRGVGFGLTKLFLEAGHRVFAGQFMPEWPELEGITLDGNPITAVPEWLISMPSLREVSLNGTRIAKLPDDLSGWRRLTILALGGCPMPKTEMERIRKALPDVAIVF